jgi:hypothetical protein
MKLSEIGENITTQRALELCRHFNLDYLFARIEADPESFTHWKFHGCSCLPDTSLGRYTGCECRDIIFRCCLPHDLCYAYGEPGNHAERKRVDAEFYSDFVTKAGMKNGWPLPFMLASELAAPNHSGFPFTGGSPV